jgi:putative DNA primase/helicase
MMSNDDGLPEDPGFEEFGDEAPPAVARLRVVRDGDEAWREALATKNDRVLPNLANVVTILTQHSEWRGCLAYDTFAERIVTTRVPPWHPAYAPPGLEAGDITDVDLSRFVLWLSIAERLAVNDRVVAQAIGVVAEKNPVHPVRDYLRSLVWDRKPRLDEASSYFGVESTEYTRAVVPRWFMSAVARIMVPGAQCDCVLILEGPTGWRKTSAFRALVPIREWYADSGIVIGSKDSYQNLHGVWIYGFDELDSLSRGELTATKNFITQTYDRFRPPFGKVARNFQRQNIFCGSTNKDDYLNDPTGDRRYWPMTVRQPTDTDAITRDRDQLWAEAVARYDAGEVWHVDTPELRKLCETEQALRRADDAWAPIVETWLRKPLGRDPADGLPMSLDLELGITTSDVLLGAIGMKAADITRGDEMRAAAVLRCLGMSRVVRPEGNKSRRYMRPLHQ